jgi:hypothetical protein
VPAEQRLLRVQRLSATAFNALQCAPESEHAQLAHRTIQRPHKSELQRSNPNGLLTWLAHQTVSGGAPDCPVAHRTVRWRTGLSGAPCDSTLPTAIFGGWGYKYPNHPTFNGVQVSTLLHLTRAIAFNTRHTKEIKSSPNSTQSFSD